MTKILGIDLGTNSIGWAIVERQETEYKLLDKGVNIFQDGVAHDKSGEKPAVAERTNARALRRHYFRRRLRKIETLKVLIKYGMCPPLTDEQLCLWKSHKKYPMNEEFMLWQRTNENTGKNPYYDRYTALTRKLNLDSKIDRYILGRAFYHLAQRRGFLSNRKDSTKEDEKGKVKKAISELSEDIEAAGCRYLGEYYYRLYTGNEKIRGKYTARNEHYRKEFDAICEKQKLSDEIVEALNKAIFFQRKLKSQKGVVGKCSFEKSKSRCPSSHPFYEEYRMLCFINNIRIQGPLDRSFRPLTSSERKTIFPLFWRKSKSKFDFEDIAKRIAGKKQNYAYKDDEVDAPYKFNYRMETSVAGSPVTAGLMDIFGDDWLLKICESYTYKEGKTDLQILNDVWHVLFSFDDDERLEMWAKDKLQLNDEQAKAFVKIAVPQDYAALSLNAITKMLPYLRLGMRYDEAVFLANLKKVVPARLWNDINVRKSITDGITSLLSDFSVNPLNEGLTKEKVVQDFLYDNFDIAYERSEHLYHPSMIEVYRPAIPDKNGILKLASPRIPALKNPMAMRALFRLRMLINRLLKEGKIDRLTKIQIEFSRRLNDANRRKAIDDYQRDNEKKRKEYAAKIVELYKKETGQDIVPTDDDILKYQLWEEQKHICLYTGNTISIQSFLGENPLYDIEHTVPRSRGGDNSQMNKTLCDRRYNREVKRAKLPAELIDHDKILERIVPWKDTIKNLRKQVEHTKGTFSTKEIKDAMIRKRHLLKMQLDYWEQKYQRFIMTEVPEGFSNRQGVDIGIINKYARLYLKTVFEKVYTVKGETTAEFRKLWGLQEEYVKKERINHVHHCIDAVTIACIGREEYDEWARYKKERELYEWSYAVKPVFKKPWTTFTEDVKAISDTLLVSHYTPDNMPKQSRKKRKIRGKIQYNEKGNVEYVQGDTARGVLHQQTFYGAIQRGDEIKYVVRKALDQLKPADINKIVDDAVRQIVQNAVDKYGFKEAMSRTIWMNESKGIPIRKVRIYTPNVVSPIHLEKEHRDLSKHRYKQHYHVTNESNYCIAIYEGTGKKEKIERTFKLINNLEAAQYYKLSNDKEHASPLVPLSDKNEYPLKCVLKAGTMVLLYEKSPQEFFDCTPEELSRRLYKVVGIKEMMISKRYCYGVITLKHHQEARPGGELKARNGEWKQNESYRPMIGLLHSQFNAYIEGNDFELSITGAIKFKHW